MPKNKIKRIKRRNLQEVVNEMQMIFLIVLFQNLSTKKCLFIRIYNEVEESK